MGTANTSVTLQQLNLVSATGFLGQLTRVACLSHGPVNAGQLIGPSGRPIPWRCVVPPSAGRDYRLEFVFCLPQQGCGQRVLGGDRMHYRGLQLTGGSVRKGGQPRSAGVANLFLSSRGVQAITFSGHGFVNSSQATQIVYGPAYRPNVRLSPCVLSLASG